MTEQAQGLVAQLRSLRLPADRSTTVVDLSGIDALSQTEAVALIRAERRFRSNGRHLTVVHTSRVVRRQLIALGLGSLLRRNSSCR